MFYILYIYAVTSDGYCILLRIATKHDLSPAYKLAMAMKTFITSACREKRRILVQRLC